MPFIYLITGPTGVGKSRVAIELAKQCHGEIISADSQQIYIGCNIGTGKVTQEEQQGVPHHCLDIVRPDRQFDAAQFIQHADAAVSQIRARNHQPIMVGGTGLYLKSFVYGLCEAAPSNAIVRQELESRYANDGAQALHEELVACDPILADAIHPNHSTRLIRALEVWKVTGTSIRFWQENHSSETPRHEVRWIGLHCERSVLRDRISQRVDQQLADGWLDEVQQLAAEYGADAPIFRAIGYRELVAYLQKGGNWDDTVARIKTATHQYAKRQMTYLRGIPEVTWLPADEANPSTISDV